MRSKVLAAALLSTAVFGAAQEPAHSHHGTSTSGARLGTVEFANSCDKRVATDFDHAVALLHSFEYDAARDAFAAIAKQDPHCAMAQWGVAMTHTHGLWGEIDVEKGRAAAQAGVRLANENSATTAREKAYLEAVAALYDGEKLRLDERLARYAKKMGALHAAQPQDDEATIFYALALTESSPPRDKTYANERQCGELLEPMFAKLPNHPGIAHYLIHCYDNDVLAPKGLEAARRYAKIAPASSHAEHMPSHIFVRLGLWPDTVESNIAAMQAAEQDKENECEARGNTMHAMHFLQFAYLQEGRLKQAREVALRSRALPKLKGECYVSGDFVAASFALDAHDWELARQLKAMPSDKSRQDALTWIAIGVGSARTGDLERARTAAAELEKLRDGAAQRSPLGKRNGTEASRLRVAAWIAEAEGKHEEAAQLMRQAADLADELDANAAWVMPPAREMLGDLLLEQKQPQAALAEYRAVLATQPRLFNPLAGAARAAEMAGDVKAAAEYRARLKEIAGGGDRAEIAMK